jgi:hypothetical protein
MLDPTVRTSAPPTPTPSPTGSDEGLGGILDRLTDGVSEIVDAVGDFAKSALEKIEAAAPHISENERIARSLVQAGGAGDASDVDLVVAELGKMPVTALRAMEAGGVKVIACRDSVTDFASDLKGVQPRGWPPGATWDSVPGAYMPDRNAVVIATTGHGTPPGAHVPATGEGHGSANLVIHESAHAVDSNVSPSLNSGSPAFNAARASDVSALPSYETQAGAAGQSESYAESAARYYGGSYGTISTPHLDAYWRDNPLGGR